MLVDDGKSERITVADNASSSQQAVTEYRVIESSSYGILHSLVYCLLQNYIMMYDQLAQRFHSEQYLFLISDQREEFGNMVH